MHREHRQALRLGDRSCFMRLVIRYGIWYIEAQPPTLEMFYQLSCFRSLPGLAHSLKPIGPQLLQLRSTLLGSSDLWITSDGVPVLEPPAVFEAWKGLRTAVTSLAPAGGVWGCGTSGVSDVTRSDEIGRYMSFQASSSLSKLL